VCYKKLKEAAVALTVIIPSPSPSLPASAKLRLEGEGILPNMIPIAFGEKHVFTIGRRDVSTTEKQRDFEFDLTDATSSISRIHAVIEQLPCGGYTIKDKSRFGTFVNGEKLLYDVPRRIFHGDRISLANTQVNYIFEECIV
jgi:pSer/pThr/pTyr-binding forkhead associated (FHA) protein